jgi:flagellar motor switch protein FliM
MNMEEGTPEFDHGARKLQGAMLEHPNLAIDRMPGLSFALNRFIAEAPARLASLIARPSRAAIEEIRATTLFEAIGECSGLTAAIYASAEPEARFMIALDERIDSLIVSSIFGEAIGADSPDKPGSDAQKPRTTIEASLVEAFARALGETLEAAFASVARVALSFERLTTIKDPFALGRPVYTRHERGCLRGPPLVAAGVSPALPR